MDFLAEAIMEDTDKKSDLSMYLRQGEQQFQLQSLNTIPIRDEFPGKFNFQIMLNNQGSSKNWIVSKT